MRALGYNTLLIQIHFIYYRRFFAGVAGVLFAYEMRFAIPELLGIQYSFLGQIMLILGGAGTLFGAAIGGLLIALLEHITSLIAPTRWPLIMGILYVIAIMFFGGIGCLSH